MTEKVTLPFAIHTAIFLPLHLPCRAIQSSSLMVGKLMMHSCQSNSRAIRDGSHGRYLVVFVVILVDEIKYHTLFRFVFSSHNASEKQNVSVCMVIISHKFSIVKRLVKIFVSVYFKKTSPRSISERGLLLLYIEFENTFCPTEPRRNICIEPFHNGWYICRS